VHVARHDFLADAAFAGDQDRGVGAGDLVGQLHHRLHGRIAGDHRPVVVGDGGQHRGDQLGFGRKRDEFLGPGADGVGGALGSAATPQATTGTRMRSASLAAIRAAMSRS